MQIAECRMQNGAGCAGGREVRDQVTRPPDSLFFTRLFNLPQQAAGRIRAEGWVVGKAISGVRRRNETAYCLTPFLARARVGNRREARIPIIAITTRSSIKVKALCGSLTLETQRRPTGRMRRNGVPELTGNVRIPNVIHFCGAANSDWLKLA